MRFWLDTEFIADGTNLELLSIGVVAENGAEFYAENSFADIGRANEWVKANVLPQLRNRHDYAPLDSYLATDIILDLALVTRQLEAFVKAQSLDGEPPEFWGWCCGLDYAVLSLAFGLERWPKDWPYYFHDIQQLAADAGVPLSESDQDGQTNRHNALEDARWIKHLWERLQMKPETDVSATLPFPLPFRMVTADVMIEIRAAAMRPDGVLQIDEGDITGADFVL